MFKHAVVPRIWDGDGTIAHPSHGKYSCYGRTFLQSDKNFGSDSARKVCRNVRNANYVGKQGQARCKLDC